MSENANALENARTYHEKNQERLGLPAWTGTPSTLTVDKVRSRLAAAAYRDMPHAPFSLPTALSYATLKREVKDQYEHLVSRGVKFLPVHPDEYHGFKDVIPSARAGTMKYNRTLPGDMPDNHPLMETVPGHPEGTVYNDLFRAVHDYFGHAVHGHSFGPQGEIRTWHEHAKLFSAAAQPALLSETHGQNSILNFSPEGSENLPIAQRPYEPQKAGLLGSEHAPVKLERSTHDLLMSASAEDHENIGIRKAFGDLLQDEDRPGHLLAHAAADYEEQNGGSPWKDHGPPKKYPDRSSYGVREPWVHLASGEHWSGYMAVHQPGEDRTLMKLMPAEKWTRTDSPSLPAVAVVSHTADDSSHPHARGMNYVVPVHSLRHLAGMLSDIPAAVRKKHLQTARAIGVPASSPHDSVKPFRYRIHQERLQEPEPEAGQYEHPAKLARVNGTASGVAHAQSKTHETRVAILRHILREAQLSPAVVRSALSASEAGLRPSAIAAVASSLSPEHVQYAAAWYGLLSGEKALTTFHPGEGEDTLHILNTPHSADQAGEYLRSYGVSPFAVEDRAPGSRVYAVNLSDPENITRGLNASHSAINGRALRLGTGSGSDADAASSRASYRDYIRKFESANGVEAEAK